MINTESYCPLCYNNEKEINIYFIPNKINFSLEIIEYFNLLNTIPSHFETEAKK